MKPDELADADSIDLTITARFIQEAESVFVQMPSESLRVKHIHGVTLEVKALADAYLAREAELAAWTDPTPLTLDVLRRDDVLGEPRANSRAGVRWVTPSGQFVVWLSHYDNAMVGEMIVETLGQLRRILSVIQETTPGGGDAEK